MFELDPHPGTLKEVPLLRPLIHRKRRIDYWHEAILCVNCPLFRIINKKNCAFDYEITWIYKNDFINYESFKQKAKLGTHVPVSLNCKLIGLVTTNYSYQLEKIDRLKFKTFRFRKPQLCNPTKI